jgi:hypothetical protein
MRKTKSLIIGSIATLMLSSFMIGNAASTTSYSGTVTKYADYESASRKKSNSSIYATNKSTTKPSGKFVSWVETTSFGSNATKKTSYSTNKRVTMKYKNDLFDDVNCANVLYTEGYRLKLNISTSIGTFNSGSVKGTWSPDNVK